MQSSQWVRWTGAATLLGMVACSSVKSGDVATSGIHVDFSATTEGLGTTAQAILRAGDAQSNTFVALDSGDTLTVTAGAETVTLGEVSLGDVYAYIGALTVQDPGTEFTFVFTRAIEESAPPSTAVMPDSFLLTAPAADTVFSRAADPITVTWDPSGSADAIQVDLHSDCILDTQIAADGDPGTYTFEVGSYEVPESAEGQSCDATLTVHRIRYGTLDGAFGSGQIYAAWQQSVEIRLDP